MRTSLLPLLIFVLSLAAIGQSTPHQLPNSKSYPAWLRPCEVSSPEGAKKSALCGKYEVFENRSSRFGRKIPINVLVLPATGKGKIREPLFYFAGGPGSAATEEAPYIAEDLPGVRTDRDLVFADQRGTGGSNPLNCNFFDASDPQSYLGHWNPPADVIRCRKELEPLADLTLYTTSIAMDDLDEIRSALGYQKIDLYGISYGTRAVQEYVRRHEKNVRSIIIQGVSLTGQFMPGDFPLANEAALNGVLNECLADTACRSAFPNIKTETRTVLEALRKGPKKVTIKIDGKTADVSLSRDLAAEAIRYMLYRSASASSVPLYLNAAANGNYTPLASAAFLFRKEIVATGANGMYLSVTCAEDLPFVDRAASIRNGENTFLGNYRLIQQSEACGLWPRSPIPNGYSDPVRSKVPALIISGQWDPVTPSTAGDKASKHLPNSTHVIVPSGGHSYGGLSGLECITNIFNKFLGTARPRSIDASCVRSIRRPGFRLAFPNANEK